MKYFTKTIDSKLFLCSRDIQVGDKFRFCGEDGIVSGVYLAISDEEKSDDYKINISVIGEYDFKVIGKVSPEAIWIKEGMEFGIEDIGWMLDDGSGKILPFTKMKELHGDEEGSFDDLNNAVLAIKSPTCKTFH